MAANRQTDIHTHAHAQSSHASMGLAQARPNNYLMLSYFYICKQQTSDIFSGI